MHGLNDTNTSRRQDANYFVHTEASVFQVYGYGVAVNGCARCTASACQEALSETLRSHQREVGRNARNTSSLARGHCGLRIFSLGAVTRADTRSGVQDRQEEKGWTSGWSTDVGTSAAVALPGRSMADDGNGNVVRAHTPDSTWRWGTGRGVGRSGFMVFRRQRCVGGVTMQEAASACVVPWDGSGALFCLMLAPLRWLWGARACGGWAGGGGGGGGGRGDTKNNPK